MKRGDNSRSAQLSPRGDGRMTVYPKKLIHSHAAATHFELSDIESQLRVTKILIRASMAVTAVLFVLLLLSYFVANNTYVGFRILTAAAATLYMLATVILFAKQRYRVATALLIGFYMLFASLALWQWGINIAFAILMLSITITLSGMLLGSRYALASAAIVCGIIGLLQFLTTLHIHLADTSWQKGQPSKVGEALGYCMLFIALAISSWLFGRQMERSLYQARKATAALVLEKQSLAVRLKQRTEKLRALQLKEIQQLYKFAELGQLSTALFHDLANHLSVLSRDLEELQTPQTKHVLGSAKTSITYIEGLVDEMRRQLSNEEHPEIFDAAYVLETVCQRLSKAFTKTKTQLEVVVSEPGERCMVYGDPTRLTQVMNILLTNARDASNIKSDAAEHKVTARMFIQDHTVNFTVADWGPGITAAARKKIFRPFFTTKAEGMGIGLFISEQIITAHFKGSIDLIHLRKPTVFQVKLPLA